MSSLIKKIHYVLGVVASLPFVAWCNPTPISLDDLTRQITQKNFKVIENALQVYQAKEAIQVARGNLLPHLNFWDLTAVGLDILNITNTIEDTAPFLIPNNWFRLSEQEILFQAENAGYEALKSNELSTARGLYYQALADQEVLEIYRHAEKNLSSLKPLVEVREKFSGQTPGILNEVASRLITLKEERIRLENLVQLELMKISYLLGMSDLSEISLTPVAPTDLRMLKLKPLDAEDFRFRVIDTSPESSEYQYLIEASTLISEEPKYSIFGVTPSSRGVAGGIFDAHPTQSGLGFGTAANVRINKTQTEILKIQKKGVEETLLRNLREYIHEYNSDLRFFSDALEREQLTSKRLYTLFTRVKLGQDIPPIEFIEASKNDVIAKIDNIVIRYRFLQNENRLARILLDREFNLKKSSL